MKLLFALFVCLVAISTDVSAKKIRPCECLDCQCTLKLDCGCAAGKSCTCPPGTVSCHEEK